MNAGIFAYLFIIGILISEVPCQRRKLILRNNVLVDDYSCVTSLKYHLKKELLMDFFIKLALNETTCPISNCSATIADVTDAAGLSTIPSNVLANATESLKLNGTRVYNAIINCNMTVNSTLYYLDLFETTFSEIYNAFVASLNNPSETIPKVLQVVNVSSPSFMAAVAYGTDTVRLQILSTGNYSLNNVKAVLNVTHKNMTEMISFIPLNKVFKNLRKINSTKLLNFFMDLGVPSSSFNNFYKTLNVSSSEFLQNPNFVKMANNIDNSLNGNVTLGIFVKKTIVVTARKAEILNNYVSNATNFIRNYSQLYLETVGNETKRYEIKNVVMNFDNHSKEVAFIQTTTPFTGKLYKASSASNFTRLFNCTYVSKFPKGGLLVENFTDAHVDKFSFTVIKSNKTVYNLGSPIFCNKNLYGLAIENYPKYINFTSFKSNATIKPTIPTIGDNTTTTKPHPSSSGKLTCSFIISLTFIGLNIFYW